MYLLSPDEELENKTNEFMHHPYDYLKGRTNKAASKGQSSFIL
jgi:hypothetical protein